MGFTRETSSVVAQRRKLCVALRFLALPMLLATASAYGQQSTPYVPRDASVVLQQVPPSTDPRVRHFEQLRSALKKSPHDVRKVVELAHAYIDYGRSTGDARFLGRAMALIEPMMAQTDPPIPVLLVHATIQQSRHFFKASRAELRHILQRDPGNAQAWLTLATVAMVQGDTELANEACVKLANSGGDFLGTTCSASLRSLTGHGKQAYALLSLVEDPGPKAPPAIKSWIQGLMADVAERMGHKKLAEMHYKNALQFTPGDNFVVADYGDFLLDQQRPQEVIDLVGADTSSDTSFLRLVLAEQLLGSPKAKTDAAQMRARFAAMDERGSHVYRREEAAFVLQVEHDPQRALKLAQQNWTVQRAPKDVLVYVQAALAANDAAAAQPVLDFLARTHLDDVRINPLVAKLQAVLHADAPASAVSARGVGR